jgi:penicillin-binding protein 1A
MNWLRSIIDSSTIQKILFYWHKIATPIAATWTWVTAPVRRLFAPVTNWWGEKTAPLRAKWANFSKKNPRAGFVLGWIATLAKYGFGFLFGLILMTWLGIFGKMPDHDDLKNIQTANYAEIFSQDSVLLGKYFIENRNSIALSEISTNVINALVSTEDKRFFEHSGVDLLGWARVLYKSLLKRNEASGGGSTLSQQLAKNLYPRRNYWVPGVGIIINKIRENIIGIRLEGIYTKDEILALYLNTVPYGGDIFGVSVAAKRYFNKKAKDLNIDQAALLVGMLKATTRYNPVRNPKLAKDRQMTVLRLMRDNKKITAEEFEKLKDKPLGVVKARSESGNEGLATYFRETLRLDLPKILEKYKKDDGKAWNIYTDGLRIYTSINSKMQTYAEEAVKEHMQKLQKQFDQHWKGYKADKPWGDDKWIEGELKQSERYENLKKTGMSDADIRKNFEEKAKMTVFSWKSMTGEADTTMSPIDSIRYYFCMLNTGFMAMDHRNGAIRAWVGGIDFKYFKYDHCESKRQVGSTFKPIVYAAAIKDSMKPCDYIPNQLKKIGKNQDWEPHNSDDRYGGYYTIAGGLRKSVNVVAAQLIEKVGLQKTIDLAKKMGITSEIPFEFGISLGAVDVSLYDMMKVFGTIANHGVRPDPYYLRRIETKDGHVIVDFDKERKENAAQKGMKRDSALTDFQSGLMIKMMEDVINSGTGRRFRDGHGIQGEFAGKTGTTQNQSDGWFICFNPCLVTGAWVGAESPAVRFRSMNLGQGSAMALPIVGGFWWKMANDKKFANMVLTKFTRPKGIDGYFGCPGFIGGRGDTSKVDQLFQFDTANVNADYVRRMKERILKMFPADQTLDVPEGGGEPGDEPLLPGQKDPKKFPEEQEKEKKKGQQILDKIKDVFKKDGSKEDTKDKPKTPERQPAKPAEPPKKPDGGKKN